MNGHTNYLYLWGLTDIHTHTYTHLFYRLVHGLGSGSYISLTNLLQKCLSLHLIEPVMKCFLSHSTLCSSFPSSSKPPSLISMSHRLKCINIQFREMGPRWANWLNFAIVFWVYKNNSPIQVKDLKAPEDKDT